MKVYSSKVFSPLLSTFLVRRLVRKHLVTVISTTALTLGGAAIYTFNQPFLYESKGSLLIENAPTDGNSLSTQAAILASRPLIETALPKIPANLSTNLSKQDLITQISDHLTITPDAKVLNISYSDRNPKTAATILQGLLETYKAYGANKANQATQLIQAQIPDAKKQLDQNSTALTRFRQQYNITDPDTYAASIFSTKQGLATQIQDLQIKMAQTQRQLQELQRQVGRPADVAISSAILSQDANYQALVKQFQEAQTNYFLERARFQDAYPKVQALRDRRDQIYNLMQAQAQAILGTKPADVTPEGQSSIKQNLATQLFDTQTRLATQTAELGSLKIAQTQVEQVFAQIPQLQQTYIELQRQLKQASTRLSTLSQKLEEAKSQEVQEATAWQILQSPSLPSYPSSPNVILNLLLAGLAGILVAAIIITVLENSDDRLQQVSQLQTLSDLPLLGAVPYLATNAKLLSPSLELISERAFLPHSYNHSAFTEAVNSLALNIQNLAAQRTFKTIAFTSSIPSEGKSTIIYNLSLTLAELGYKVLLVDADMRKPTIHSLAGVSNKLGLSQAIATKLPWQQIIHTGDHSQFSAGYLHIITAGATPPNPMILLESNKFQKLLGEWDQTYDYVLIDTPPIVGITDAQSLAPRMDGVVLVTAIEKATKQAIFRAIEILKINNCKVAGILVNLVDRYDSIYCYDYSTSEYYSNQTPQRLLSAASDSDE
ncbi:capsular exopolysaccharide biosynthesis protein [Synechococcus sp. PCC 7502]|uniref:polysaccharide biosynthesis tyrosine autokinase n=1 Tax=Synechococcus sp. PCC 7502 TaxID=1173263 RepID=UPI00029F84B4|nr:polysaccharide biosynthesis tyrosine autokinase [Synechococcus sp. PCC 7502]AFY73180.1 capsular exopolysaccharide biosynthesis protein [Synechococcus sp. PCC 7502]